MTVHVAGAGLAGLATALTAAKAGHKVIIHEAAAQAGGRCRSFEDRTLGQNIDNGTHVLLGTNGAAFDFLDTIKSTDSFVPSAPDGLPFFDLALRESWTIDVGGRAIPALLKASGSLRRALTLAWRTASVPARKDATVADIYKSAGAPYDRLIAPLCTAIMNAAPEKTPARTFLPVIRAVALGGDNALCLFTAKAGLGPALVDPAIIAIEALGGELRLHDPLLGIEARSAEIRSVNFRSGSETLSPDDVLVLALPPWALDILPDEAPSPPVTPRGIICTHFAVRPDIRLPHNAKMMAIIDGTAQWLALSGETLSVTISAADHLMDYDGGDIAQILWTEIQTSLALNETPLPTYRVIKERRATAEVSGSFGPQSPYSNLIFAGGWTDGQYPDTIEAAITSGNRAAICLTKRK
jgi:hypothetical protein